MDNLEDISDLTKQLEKASSKLEQFKDNIPSNEYKKFTTDLSKMTDGARTLAEELPRLKSRMTDLKGEIDIAREVLSKTTAGTQQHADITRRIAELEGKQVQLFGEYTEKSKTAQQRMRDLSKESGSALEKLEKNVDKAGKAGGIFKKITGWIGRLIPGFELLVSIARGFGLTMSGAAAAAAPIALTFEAFRRFYSLDKVAKDFRVNTGITTSMMITLQKAVRQINVDLAELGVSLDDIYKTAQGLYEAFQTMHLVTTDDVQTLSKWSANIGLGAADVAKMKSLFTSISQSLGQSVDDTILLGSMLAKAGGVAPAQVLKDMADSTEEMLMFMARSPMYMMRATVEARRMGTTIKSIASSAKGFLNYQESITNELNASALLGKSVNFQEARSLAYQNKIVESRQAALRIVKSVGDFTALNVYQQEALAKAAGMTVEEIIKQQNSEKQLSALKNSSLQKDKDLAEKWEKTLQRINGERTKDVLEDARSAAEQQDRQSKIEQILNRLKSSWVAFTDSMIPVVEELMPTIEAGIRDIGEMFKNFATFLRENEGAIKALGKVFATVVDIGFSLLTGVLSPINDIMVGFGFVNKNTKTTAENLKASQQALQTSQSAGTTVSKNMAETSQNATSAASATAQMQQNLTKSDEAAGKISNQMKGITDSSKKTEESTKSVFGSLYDIVVQWKPLSALATATYGAMGNVYSVSMEIAKVASRIGNALSVSLNNIAAMSKINFLEKITTNAVLFFSEIEKFAGKFGNLGEALGAIAVKAGELFGKFKWVSSLTSGISNLGSKFAIVGEIFGALSKVSWIGKIAVFFGKWVTPIGWIITGAQLIYNIFNRFRENLDEIANAGFFGKIGIGLKAVGLAIYDTLVGPFVDAYKAIKKWIGFSPSELGLSIVKGISSVSDTIFDWLISPFTRAWQWIKSAPFINKLFGNIDATGIANSEIKTKVENQITQTVQVKNLDELKETVDKLSAAIIKLGGVAGTVAPVVNVSNNNNETNQKLDELINLLRSGAIGVNIDGIMVSKALATKS